MTKLDLIADNRPVHSGDVEGAAPKQSAATRQDGPAHWRSLDHLEGTPASRGFLEREFPYGAALTPDEREAEAEASGTVAGKDGFQRRDALKLMGASLALAGVGSACIRRPEEEILPYARMPEHEIPGLARYYASSYPGPNGAVGIVVEAHEGRPTKIEGNPDHPASKGRANVWMQAHTLELYDPDRSRTPRKAGAETTWSAWDSDALPALKKKLAGNGGQGLAILSDAEGGPTFDRVKSLVQQQYPRATFYSYDLLRADNVLQGAELAFGPGARVDYDLENANVILSLDSNFLAYGPNQVKNAWGFSRGRSFERIPTSKQAALMNRLYCVESAFTTTGANADHRLRVRSSEIAGFAKALASELGKRGVSLSGVSGLSSSFKASDEKFIPALAQDLANNRAKAIVLVGDDQPAAVHALGHLINQALGAFGSIAKLSMPAGTVTPAASGSDESVPDTSATPTTTTTTAPHESSIAQLSRLTKALEGGQVDTLVILGANPVYASPEQLGFAAALAKAKQVIHLGLYADETAAKAEWHLPMAHPLETWGDALSWSGIYSPIQPLIQPLHNGRSAIEWLAQLAGSSDTEGRALVEATFLSGGGSSWKKALHDGVAPGLSNRTTTSAGTAQAAAASTALGQLKDATGDELEVLFQPSFTILDGRYANLGWLQECTDPMTKLVWGNAAVLSPALARKLGVKAGLESNVYVADVLRIELGGKAVELPAFILPGVEASTVVLSLGYGRQNVGEVANDVGVNVYPIVPADGSRFARGAKVTKTGRRETLLGTQDHFSVETVEKPLVELEKMSLGGRQLAVVRSTEEYAKNPKIDDKVNLAKNLWEKDVPQPEQKPVRGLQTFKLNVTEQPWEYDGQAWGMTIDLTACIGCQACVVACQSENNIPVVGPEGVEFGRELHWIRIDRYFTGDVDNPQAVAQPVPCMHCENAPCEPVCPVAATVHDEEGLNAMVYNRCIGTRYCANNCPYKVRRFNYFDYSASSNIYLDPALAQRQKTLKMLRNPDVTVRYRGVMEKCTYCTQRIQTAKYEAKKRGEDPRNLPDGAVTPACAQTCPTNAIVFGNINGKKAGGEPYEVAKRKSSERNYEMLSDLNNRPRTTFLAKLRNTNPELV